MVAILFKKIYIYTATHVDIYMPFSWIQSQSDNFFKKKKWSILGQNSKNPYGVEKWPNSNFILFHQLY